METLRIGIIVRSFPAARLTLQPWRYLTDLARAVRAEGHEACLIVGERGIDAWDAIPVERHEPHGDFENAGGLRALGRAHRLDGGVCRLTANLFSSMRPEQGPLPDGGTRLVGVFLRALPRGPDLLRRYLDPVLISEAGMDLHHLALFLSRQRRTWRLASQYFSRFVFLWDGDRATGTAGGLPPASCETLPVPFDPFFLDRTDDRTPAVMEGIPASDRRVVFAGPAEPSRGVREVLRLPRVLSRRTPTQVLVLLRTPESPEVRLTATRVGPHSLVLVRGMLPREDQRAIYRASQAAVFPYRWVRTGFPLVIAEAVAAGLPVATTRVHPFRDLEGRSGLVFADRGDVRGLAAAVERVLDGTSHDALARANEDWIRRTPAWAEVARGYIEAMRA